MYYSNNVFWDQSDEYHYDEWSVLSLLNCNVNELADFQHNFHVINIVKCNEVRSFCDFSPIKNVMEFRTFFVDECDGLEFLFSSSLATKGALEKLKHTGLFKLKNLSSLFNQGVSSILPILPPYGTCFVNLRKFLIRDCARIKKLFPLDLVPNLKNLETIDVNNCNLLEEIFISEGGEQIKPYSLSLPKLSRLRLADLPELKSICNVGLLCDALKKIEFKRCPKLNMDHVQVYCTPKSFERVLLSEL